MGSDGIYGGKAKSKRCVFRYFLKVATELAERTDSERLFQRDGVQEWKALAPVSVLTLGTDKLLLCTLPNKFFNLWAQYVGHTQLLNPVYARLLVNSQL